MQSAQASVSHEPDLARVEDENDQSALEVTISASQAVSLAQAESDRFGLYLSFLTIMIALLLAGIAYANVKMSPWIYSADKSEEIAEAMLAGENFGLFDLNIDIRGIRRAQFENLQRTPDVILLGASHWQEAHVNLLPNHDLMNAHVHRDYYDDILAAVEVMLTTGHLPENLIITIRDATFTAAADRGDFLWIPFIPEFRAMEARLGLEKRPWYRDYPLPPIVDYFSLPTVISNLFRSAKAKTAPGPTDSEHSESLDTFLADGSVHWSEEHQRAFTPERAKRLASEDAARMRRNPPVIDPAAIEAVDAVLGLVHEQGVNIVLVHPPFNPIYFDAVQGSAYAAHLEEISAITRRLATKYDAKVAGSFDPRNVGCDSSMYIDAEHSRPNCLGKLLQLVAVHLPN